MSPTTGQNTARFSKSPRREPIQTSLSDKTRVAGTTWGSLKHIAMRDDYEKQGWFVSNHLEAIKEFYFYLELI